MYVFIQYTCTSYIVYALNTQLNLNLGIRLNVNQQYFTIHALKCKIYSIVILIVRKYNIIFSDMRAYVIIQLILSLWPHSTSTKHESNKHEYTQPKDATRYVSTGF